MRGPWRRARTVGGRANGREGQGAGAGRWARPEREESSGAAGSGGSQGEATPRTVPLRVRALCREERGLGGLPRGRVIQ